MAAREDAEVADSLQRYVEMAVGLSGILDEIQGLSGVKWFRGCEDIGYLLEPSLLREPYVSRPDFGQQYEKRLNERFINRAHAFVTVPSNIVDRFILMQHFGHPTRVLDWTENALAALYFAVKDENTQRDGCVWFLAAQGLARRVANIERDPDFDGDEIPGSSDRLLNYRASEPVEFGKAPVPFYPANLNARVAAQGGCFTLHSLETGGLEDMATAKEQGSYLFPLRIPGPAKSSMLSGLRTLGVTESTLFPDLDGLARDARMLQGDNPFKRRQPMPPGLTLVAPAPAAPATTPDAAEVDGSEPEKQPA